MSGPPDGAADGAIGPSPQVGGRFEVFRVAVVLGLTSFGGPIAHLGYFHREYVERRRWLSESTYLDLVALSQLLPGPASSQVGIAVGLIRAGWSGALAAWAGFTLPSAVALTAFALLTGDVDVAQAGWIHGLKLAAVVIVAAAVLSMWRTLAPDRPRKTIALLAAAAILLVQAAVFQV
ncbi:MAG TPA: chromate transporter, partial [Vitreimonas sp.]|nr:chromate transporter [Vitreimonas sp.]